jgi:hypothetical protein
VRANLLFRPTEIMISPSVSKVNNASHLADFAAHRDCSAVEAAPAARRVPPAGTLGVCQGATRVPLGMSSIHSECLGSDPSDRSVAADVLHRQERDEEEDEEEDEGDGNEEDDDDDEGDDGYSE